MVNASLRKVSIKNFKSLHDCEIDIKELNVVVGANASGKSNLVEVFRLLKKIYVDKDINPFSEWWGYDNVVWGKNEELPVTIGLDFDIEGYDVYFETTFTGIGGSFQILREVLDVRGYVKFEKEGGWITVKHDANFIEDIVDNIDDYEVKFGLGFKSFIIKNKNKLIKYTKIRTDFKQKLFENKLLGIFITNNYRAFYNKKTSTGYDLFIVQAEADEIQTQLSKKSEMITILCPTIKEEERGLGDQVYHHASIEIPSFIRNLLTLYPLNIRSMKKPQPFKREDKLKEDGSNIANVFHSIYMKPNFPTQKSKPPTYGRMPRKFLQFVGRNILHLIPIDLRYRLLATFSL